MADDRTRDELMLEELNTFNHENVNSSEDAWVPTGFTGEGGGALAYFATTVKSFFRYFYPEERREEKIDDNLISNILQDKLKTSGPSRTADYVKYQIEAWKNEPVKFAVIGRSGIGKSTFINMVRKGNFGNDGEAKTGLQDTTEVVKQYVHPENEKLVYFDSPGFSLSLEREEILKRLNLPQFDYFLFFFDLLRAEDYDFIQEIINCCSPFCLIRNRVDIDVNFGKKNGRDENATISELRQKIKSSIKKRPFLKDAAMFCISSVDSSIGEFDELDAHMKKSLSTAKYEAVMLSLPTVTEKVIETKFQKLISRISFVSVAAGIVSVIPVPIEGIKLNCEIVRLEIEHYIKILGLQTENIQNVSGLTCRVYEIGVSHFLESELESPGNNEIVAAITRNVDFIPGGSVAVSAIVSGIFVRILLLKTLKEMRSDAYTVFNHHFETE